MQAGDFRGNSGRALARLVYTKEKNVEALKNFLLRLGRMLTVLGVSDPDEVKRKRERYEAQRAARKAREAAAQSADPSAAVIPLHKDQ